MQKIDFADIQVVCPGSLERRIEKMQVRFFNSPTVGRINAPLNGCNSSNGTMPCKACCTALTAMFFRDPDIDVSLPFSPDLTLLKAVAHTPGRECATAPTQPQDHTPGPLDEDRS